MAILLIDKIKQKNNGTFKLMDAFDINWEGFSVPTENIDAYTKQETANLIEVSKYDDSTLKASIKSNTDAIGILNGEGEGSVDKKVADAVAKIINGAPEARDTLKEISDWIDGHAKDAATMNSQIETNKTDIANLVKLVGTLPVSEEAKTIVEYIDSKVGAIDYSDAIETAKQAAIDAAAADATSKANQALIDAKKYSDDLGKNYATADQGAKADTALQAADITEGATNGTIAVKGIDLEVHGLGTAAFVGTETFDPAGAADDALDEAKGYVNSAITDISDRVAEHEKVIGTHTEELTNVGKRVTTAEGKLDTIQGTGEGSISKAVEDAKTELQGQITANKEILDKLDGADTVDGSVAKQVKDAKTAIENKIGTVTEDKTVVEMIADAQEAATYDDSTVKASIAENAEAITTLETGKVATNTTDISELKTKVKNLENVEFVAITKDEIDALFN